MVRREGNRILLLCSAINDHTSWPFWKFLQLKKVRGVKDIAMLAFNSEGGSFEAELTDGHFTWKNYENVRSYNKDQLERWLHRWYAPGRSYFVYGGHGMGDYLELEKNKIGLQVHELAGMMGPNQQYEAAVFDACFMANLDCVYHLRKNAKLVGGCEGYMWEEDQALDKHIFNTFTASAMSRFTTPRTVLDAVSDDFTKKSDRADFAILDTDRVEKLYRFIHTHVYPNAYKTLLPETEDRTWSVPRHALYPSEHEDSHLADALALIKDLPADLAEQGTELFEDVVLSHTPPRLTDTYPVPLNGLSVTMHKLSNMSVPLKEKIVPLRRAAKRKPTILATSEESTMEAQHDEYLDVPLEPLKITTTLNVTAAVSQQQQQQEAAVNCPEAAASVTMEPQEIVHH